MLWVKGTEGYAAATERFVVATHGIAFQDLHQSILQFIPTDPSHVLDVGSGIGRDAAVLAEMGHTVVAVEPTREFLSVAQSLYGTSIEWIDDSLPLLQSLEDRKEGFDFALVSAVWHHIDQDERRIALTRIADLLRPTGIFALSLRHGPAGVGTHIFPTDGQETVQEAERVNLKPLLVLENQPSLVKGKKNVTWTRIVLQKVSESLPSDEA